MGTNAQQAALDSHCVLRLRLATPNYRKLHPTTPAGAKGVMCLSKSMELRTAEVDDAQEIATVHVAAWRHAYKKIIDNEILSKLDIANKTKVWESLLSQNDWPAYVVVNQNDIVEGFVHLCAYRDDDFPNQRVGEISSIYINPEMQGQGLGAMLLRKSISYFEQESYSKVALWVLEHNKLAISFYKKFSFMPDGGIKIHTKTGLKELRYVFENLNT